METRTLIEIKTKMIDDLVNSSSNLLSALALMSEDDKKNYAPKVIECIERNQQFINNLKDLAHAS